MYIEAVRKALILAIALALGCNRSQPSPATPQAAPHRPDLSVKIQVPPAAAQLQVVPPGQIQAAPSGQSPTTRSWQVPPAAPGQAAGEAPLQITKHDVDTPLLLAGQTFHFVAHTAQIEHPGPRSADDETVESWEFRDPSGAVVYRNIENSVTPAVYHGTFEYSESISASALNGKQGSGVILEGFDLPSTENDGWTQLFGLNPGKLKPLRSPDL